jgi:hypothetical protein
MKAPVLLSTALILSLPAAEKLPSLKLADGTVLEQVEIREVTAEGVRLSHKNGSGLIPAGKLPPGWKSQVAAKAEEKDQAAIKAVEERIRKRKEAAARDNSLSLRCAAVKHAGAGDKILGGGYRYFVVFHNHSKGGVAGKLRVSTENGNGVVNYGADYEVDIPAGGARSGFFSLSTAPPVLHGTAGVIKLRWNFVPTTGHETTGECAVPDIITP